MQLSSAGVWWGIESGAGVVGRSRDALAAYGLQDDFRIVTGTEEIMVDRLETAVFRGEWVVVTGWSPHWVFERYSLRFLDDPRGVFGGPESIHTMVRRGFAQDRPIVATVLGRDRVSTGRPRTAHALDRGGSGGRSLRAGPSVDQVA